MVVFLVGAGVLAIVSIVGFLELVLNGSAEALGAIRRLLTGRESDRSFVRGAVRLALAVVVFMLPFRAVERAEEGNRWADTDGNDLLDPHSDGAYTWAEVNGPDFVRTWGIGAGIVLVVAAATYRPSRWRMPDLRRRGGRPRPVPPPRASRSGRRAAAARARRRDPILPAPVRPPGYDPIPAYGAHATPPPTPSGDTWAPTASPAPAASGDSWATPPSEPPTPSGDAWRPPAAPPAPAVSGDSWAPPTAPTTPSGDASAPPAVSGDSWVPPPEPPAPSGDASAPSAPPPAPVPDPAPAADPEAVAPVEAAGPEVDPLADFLRSEAPAEELPEAFPPSEPVPLRSQRAEEPEPPEDPLTSFLPPAAEPVTPAEAEEDEAGDGEATRSSSG